MNAGKIIRRSLGSINLLFVLLMIIVAYSEQIHPEKHHLLSLLGLTFPFFITVNICFACFWIFIGQFRYLLLSLIGFSLCISQTRSTLPLNLFRATPPEKSIKLLSYNVMGFNHGLKTKEGNPILHYLKESGADIICLQEYAVSRSKAQLTQTDVSNALKDYPYHKINTAGSLTCYSKYPILSATPIFKKNGNAAVSYEIQIGQDTLTLINCHLQSNRLTQEDKDVYEDIIVSPKTAKVREGFHLFTKKLGEAYAARAPQAESVAQAIKDSRHRNVIVAGDFNEPPVSYAHHVIGQHLNDAFAQSGIGFGISYHLNHFYFRIDNIMLSSGLKSYQCCVDNTISDSDHYPIWCFVAKKD